MQHHHYRNITSEKLAKGAPSLRHMVLLSNALSRPQIQETCLEVEEEFEDGEYQRRAAEEWLDGVLEEMIMQEEIDEEDEEDVHNQTPFSSGASVSRVGGEYVNVSFRHPPPATNPHSHALFILHKTHVESDSVTDSGYHEGATIMPSISVARSESSEEASESEEDDDEEPYRLRADLSSSYLVLNEPVEALPPLPESPPRAEDEVPGLGFSPPDCTFKPGHLKWKRSMAGSSDWESSNDSLPLPELEDSTNFSKSPTIAAELETVTAVNRMDRERSFPFRGVTVFEEDESIGLSFSNFSLDEEEEARGRSRDYKKVSPELSQGQPIDSERKYPPWKFTPDIASSIPTTPPNSYYNTFNVLHFHPFVPPVLISSPGTAGPTRKSVSATRSPFTPVPPPPPPLPPVSTSFNRPPQRFAKPPPPPLAPPPPPVIPVWATRRNKRDGLVKVCKSEMGVNGEVDIMEDKKVDTEFVRSFYDCTDLGEARGWFMRG